MNRQALELCSKFEAERCVCDNFLLASYNPPAEKKVRRNPETNKSCTLRLCSARGFRRPLRSLTRQNVEQNANEADRGARF